jgi:hypothetical protein
MARSVKDETNDLILAGLAQEVIDNKFGARVRNVDQDPMDQDDEFTIPADYKVLAAAIVPGGDPVKFILVELKNRITGVTRNVRFFPNMLAKTIRPVVNGKLDGSKVKTVGTAAKEYQKFADQGVEGMDNAVQALVGKKIRITAKTPYVVFEYGTTKETTTNIYTYDFVE